jgi:hypothetical protein
MKDENMCCIKNIGYVYVQMATDSSEFILFILYETMDA